MLARLVCDAKSTEKYIGAQTPKFCGHRMKKWRKLLFAQGEYHNLRITLASNNLPVHHRSNNNNNCSGSAAGFDLSWSPSPPQTVLWHAQPTGGLEKARSLDSFLGAMLSAAMNGTMLAAGETAVLIEAFNEGSLGVSFGIAGRLGAP